MEKNFKKETIRFLKLFLVLFLMVFIGLNITGWLVRPKKIETESPLVPEEKTEEEETKARKQECVFSEKADSIAIPKIGIEAPLILVENTEMEELSEGLKKGVVFYPGSSLPGEKGETMILGHSAPPGWPKIRYDWVFSELNKLEEEDEVYVFYKNCRYVYKISEKFFLNKGEELPPPDLTKSESMLLLISCWPPGRNLKRIAVRAELIK